MSDYQAAWIAEDDREEDRQDNEEESDDDDDDDDMMDLPAGEDDCSESEGEEEEAMANIDSQTETMTEAGDEDYDAKHVNFASEVDALEALKNARVDSMFPDEVDTPQVFVKMSCWKFEFASKKIFAGCGCKGEISKVSRSEKLQNQCLGS